MNSKGSAKLSYWEIDQYYKTFDVVIVGSGIVGLSAAISIREKQKNASVLILEKGFLPSGASTKNAGFACFGSPSELLDDLSKMPEASA
jgi:gamma-glutamylputrescine oxidase